MILENLNKLLFAITFVFSFWVYGPFSCSIFCMRFLDLHPFQLNLSPSAKCLKLSQVKLEPLTKRAKNSEWLWYVLCYVDQCHLCYGTWICVGMWATVDSRYNHPLVWPFWINPEFYHINTLSTMTRLRILWPYFPSLVKFQMYACVPCAFCVRAVWYWC